MKKNSSINRFVQMREDLIQEREVITNRLNEINGVLGENGTQMPVARKGRKGRRGVRGPAQEMSLKEAVTKVLEKAPNGLDKQTIFDRVQKLGYRFGGSSPINTLGVVLYGKQNNIRNDKGVFSLMGRKTSTPKAVSIAK